MLLQVSAGHHPALQAGALHQVISSIACFHRSAYQEISRLHLYAAAHVDSVLPALACIHA